MISALPLVVSGVGNVADGGRESGDGVGPGSRQVSVQPALQHHRSHDSDRPVLCRQPHGLFRGRLRHHP